MGVSPIASGALHMAQSQAQWDAIASIKANSPFASGGSGAGSAGAASTVASGFDAMLSGYNAQAQLLAAAVAPDAGTTTALLYQLASVQQTTIDLFA